MIARGDVENGAKDYITARNALYLSSKASGFVCGATIAVDGGYATTA